MKENIKESYKIIIIGGGDGGSAVAKLLKKFSNINLHNICMIEPQFEYRYQSLQTCVGAGILPLSWIHFPNKYLFPKGIVVKSKTVELIDPDNNKVYTQFCGFSVEKIFYSSM